MSAYGIDALFEGQEKLKAIAELMKETGLTKIKLKNDDGGVASEIELERGAVIASAAPASAGQPAASAGQTEQKAETVDGTPVTAPMVGVFYAAPSPEEEPYVKVGDRVKKGDTLCIIEAMKLMNEITAEQDGEIAAICVEDGNLVEYGQKLFVMK